MTTTAIRDSQVRKAPETVAILKELRGGVVKVIEIKLSNLTCYFQHF